MNLFLKIMTGITLLGVAGGLFVIGQIVYTIQTKPQGGMAAIYLPQVSIFTLAMAAFAFGLMLAIRSRRARTRAADEFNPS